MKHPLLTLVPALLLTPLHAADPGTAPTHPQADGLARLARDFSTLPLDARRADRARSSGCTATRARSGSELEVDKVAEGGNGCFTTESRPHNDWLGPNWFRDVGICLDAAKKHGLQLWIFDEKWWPSQSVGGKVPAALCGQAAGGRGGGGGRTTNSSRPTATPASATWRRWPGGWPPMGRSTPTAWWIWRPSFRRASSRGRCRPAAGRS